MGKWTDFSCAIMPNALGTDNIVLGGRGADSTRND